MEGCAKKGESITLVVNGSQITVRDPDPRVCLGDFLREEMGLKGLQMPCRQGGCGGCTVLLSSSIPPLPINACLTPLCSTHAMSLTTVEGVGTLKTGLAPLQQALVQYHGTQCGFCTPGMIMSMHSLLKSNPNPTKQQVEDQLDGNLCRCTGYRSILDAFQTFSGKGNKWCTKLCEELHTDIEDCLSIHQGRKEMKVFSRDGLIWINISSLRDLLFCMQKYRGMSRIRLVKGNTITGVVPQPNFGVCLNISNIPELLKVNVSSKGLVLGGAISIAVLMNLLEENKGISTSYGPILTHLQRVATPQVRSIGSIAGNLMMAHQYQDFVSDIATIFMAAKAKIKVLSAFNWEVQQLVTLEEFFVSPMDDTVILEVHLPILQHDVSFLTYKSALRRVNAHAIVNAAFNFRTDVNSGLILESPSIVYGGVKSYPQRASITEKFLNGKCFRDPEVFNTAMQLLLKELIPDISFGRTKYRSSLIVVYFYKAFLSLWPKECIPLPLRSSIVQYFRPISTGQISFGKGDPSEYPVSKPLAKLSSASQVTGDAEYLDDLNDAGVLHAAYVVSSAANARISLIDPSKALAMDGVVMFISAETVTTGGYCNNVSEYELVFASTTIQYYGQALGLIVAKSKEVASSAAKLVEVVYVDEKKPILTIEDALEMNSFFEDRNFDFKTGSTEAIFKSNGIITVEGKVSIGHQYHFHLETQRALCVPGENGTMQVYSSTQNPAQIQRCVGIALNRQQHKITVEVKRVGGAYGSKLNRSASIAMACAIAADKVGRPVKLVLDLSTNMQLVGSRSPYMCKYKVAAESSGRIRAVDMLVLNNQGAHFDFEYPDMSNLAVFIDCAYNIPNWKIQGKIARTNLPACTYMRGPVFVEATFMLETAIEHISSALGLHSDVVREINMYSDGDVTLAGQHLVSCNAKSIFNLVKESSQYDKRLEDVNEFNSANQWVKRGISLVPVKFCATWEAQQTLSLVNIYPDGSISIHHSGCELGQGLDVKVAQVAAMTLGAVSGGGIRLEDIYVHSTTSIVANNGAESGGSVTSELCAKAVQSACEILVGRLATLSKLMTSEYGKPVWQALISMAIDAGVDLQSRGRIYPGPGPNGPFQYISFGAGATEAEVDLLTGETRILRADLLLDCGKSLNPAIDVGQMQGAYIQGLGYHLMEEFIFDPISGRLLSDGTWEYKPPSSKDIPIIFNTSLLADSMNPTGFLRSKFSGEPPYGLACGAIFAVRQAIIAAKIDRGENGWCELNSPATIEKVALAAAVPIGLLQLNDFTMPTT